MGCLHQVCCLLADATANANEFYYLGMFEWALASTLRLIHDS